MSQVAKHANNAERQAAYRQRRARAEAAKANESGLVPLPAIGGIPGTVRWRQALAYAEHYLSEVRDEMRAYHDERTERWQESDKAAEFLERLEQIERIVDDLREVGASL